MRLVMSQHCLGNRGHLIQIAVARLNHGKFHPAHVLGIIFRITACEPHMALNCEKIREQSARQHDNETGVGEMNAQLSPGPAETFCMGSNEIHEQHCANEMTTRENRDLEATTLSGGHHTNMLWK